MVESPTEVPQNETEADDLASLPPPPRRARTVSLAFMGVAGLLAVAMAVLLWGDVRYALRATDPIDLGDLGALSPGPELDNTFVQGTAIARVERGLRYTRKLEPDQFLLAPIVGNGRIWIEMRAPAEPVLRAAAIPMSFVGRLVAVRGGGFRRGGFANSAHGPTAIAVPEDAWVLLDGVAPGSLHWTVALVGLFALFAAWCLTNIVRIVRPVRG
jgi:hypothetical protein